MVLSFSRLLISGALILLVSAKNAVSMNESKTVENKPADFRSEVTSPHCLCETGNETHHRYTCSDNKNNTVDLLIHHKIGENISISVCCRSCPKTVRNPNIILKYFGRQTEQEIEYSPTSLESCAAPEIIINEIYSYTNVQWFTGTTWFHIYRCSNDVASISLPENLFRPLSNLRWISLTGNDSYASEIPMNFFDQSPVLQHLRVTKAGLTQLEDDTFKHLAMLEELYLNHNRLSNLRRELFTPLYFLGRLDLSSNNIVSLREDVFFDLKSLTDLRLNENILTHLPKNIFSEQALLQLVDLSNNRLKELPGTLFHTTFLLKSVYLESNHLNSFDKKQFSNFPNLDFEEVRNMSFQEYNSRVTDWKLFGNMKELFWLNLRGNQLTELVCNLPVPGAQCMMYSGMLKWWYPGKRPEYTRELVLHIYMDNNNISFPNQNCSSWFSTSRSGFSSACHEIRLSFLNNPISCDCRNYNFLRSFLLEEKSTSYRSFIATETKKGLRCYTPEHMRNVLVSEVNWKNMTCPVEDECPQNCSCIHRAKDDTITVKCNTEFLTFLPSNYSRVKLFVTKTKLKNPASLPHVINSRNVVKLSFSDNAIQSIDGFKVPPKLKELELDHNEISRLRLDSIKMLNKSGMIITLAGNPWKCECDTIEDLLDFLRHTSSEIKDKDRILCDGTGSRVIDVSKFELCYKPFFIIAALLAGFGILFGSSTVLYMKYEYEIKVFMFVRKICLCLISEKEIDRDKEYDAFISYCHQDEDFVAKKLVPGLETEPHCYKLCLHYRDWIPGELIVEQVVKSVESSRRTIIVLSRDYLKSKWGSMEFMTAYVKGLQEGVPRVIIILLEELDTSKDDLSPELKAYVSTRTYLKWDDSRFWDKLQYALPHHQRNDVKRKRTVKSHVLRRNRGGRIEEDDKSCIPLQSFQG